MQGNSYDPKNPAWGRFTVSEHIHLNPGSKSPGIHRIQFRAPDGYPKIGYASICDWSRARAKNQDFEINSVAEPGPGVNYWPGSILNVRPVLGRKEALALTELVDTTPEEIVEIDGQRISVLEIIATRFDNSGPVKPGFIKALSKLAPNSKILDAIKGADREGKTQFGTSLDVMQSVFGESRVRLPLDEMIKACKRPITCRRYTIASHSLHSDNIELIVVEATAKMASGRIDRGICSAMLAECKVGDIVDAQVMVKPDYPPLDPETKTVFLFGRGSGYSGLPHFAWDAIKRHKDAEIILATGGTTIKELANLEELEALSQAGVQIVAALREPETAREYLSANPNTKIHFVGKPIEQTMEVPKVADGLMKAMREGEARICGGPGPTGALTDWLMATERIKLYPEAEEMYNKYSPEGPHKGDKAKALRRHCMKAMEVQGEFRGKVFVDVF